MLNDNKIEQIEFVFNVESKHITHYFFYLYRKKDSSEDLERP